MGPLLSSNLVHQTGVRADHVHTAANPAVKTSSVGTAHAGRRHDSSDSPTSGTSHAAVIATPAQPPGSESADPATNIPNSSV